MFLFPYEQLDKNAKVALYGAGKVGQDYFTQIMGTGFCKLVVWVDNNFAKYQEEYMPVYPVSCLDTSEFDFVVIAVLQEEIADQIKAGLIDRGISEEKIIWKGNNRNYEFWCAKEDRKQQQQELLQNKFQRGTEEDKPIFWILNTPYHGNVGDHAITIAEQKFLKEFFPEVKNISVTGKEIDENLMQLKNAIRQEDVLFITGGGYMGTLWEEEDKRVQSVLDAFPDNKIIFFPQTFYYGNDEKKTEEDSAFYGEKENVLFLHRERNSYNYFTENILKDCKKNKCVPDMVLYLDERKDTERTGILLCFRGDKETVLTAEAKQEIETILCEQGETVKKIDTVYDFLIEEAQSEGMLQHTLSFFRSSELVITDRLHGMIFAQITGTPCIVFDNVTKKVSGVSEWIKEQTNLIVKSNTESLWEDINRLRSNKSKEISLYQEYSKIAEIIKRYIGE